jgi:hypothetical protein
MHHQRLQSYFESYRLPEPPRAQPAVGSFIGYPMGLLAPVTADQWLAQQWLYRVAFEQAQAVVRPSLLERDLLAVWN